MAIRRTSFAIVATGEIKPMTSHDQVSVSGLLDGGAVLSVHYRGGMSRGTNLLWEINGTQGDLQITAFGGHAQIFEMTVNVVYGNDQSLQVMPQPELYLW